MVSPGAPPRSQPRSPSRAPRPAALLVAVVVAAATVTSCLPIPPAPPSPPADPPTVALYGDSVALTLGWWGHDGFLNRATYVGGPQSLGCGIGRGGLRWRYWGSAESIKYCDDYPATWSAHARTHRPDVALVVTGPWDQLLRLVPGDSAWRALGDPIYNRWLLDEMLMATDTLLMSGAGKVAWVALPPMYGPEHDAAESTRRALAFRELMRWVQVLRPGKAVVIDFWAWLGPQGLDPVVRPDGVHFSEWGAPWSWRSWLAAEAVQVAG